MSLRGKSGVWGRGRGPLMIMADFLFLLISNVLGRGCGAGMGPIMMMKDSLFLLISNVVGRGPSNDDEGISVFAGLKCFRNWVWGWERGPLMMLTDSLFLLISNVLGRGPSNDDDGISVSADFKCFTCRKGAQ